MIREDQKRICGLHTEENGDYAAVWMAQNPETGRIRVYDCALFRQGEVPAVVAESLNARGRWIPVAWNNPVLADELMKKHRCRMLPDQCPDTGPAVEIASRELQQRMRARTFTVDEICGEWLDEFKRFTRFDSRVPTEGFPLMAATRHGVQCLQYARAEKNFIAGDRQRMHPRIAIV